MNTRILYTVCVILTLFTSTFVTVHAEPDLPTGPSDFPNDIELTTANDGLLVSENVPHIAQDPNDRSSLFTCKPSDTGTQLVRSTDGGETWGTDSEAVSIGTTQECDIDVRPGGSDVAICQAGPNVNVSISSDGGQSWDETSATLDNVDACAIWWVDADSLAIAWLDTDTDDLVTSSSNDTGSTWDAGVIRDASADSNGFQPSGVSKIGNSVVLVYADAQLEFMRSSDGGFSWTAPETVDTANSPNRAGAVDHIDEDSFIVMGNDGTNDQNEYHRTDDNGTTWNSVGTVSGTVAANFAVVVLNNSAWTSVDVAVSERGCSSQCMEVATTVDNGTSYDVVLADDGTDCACDRGHMIVPGNEYRAITSMVREDEEFWFFGQENPSPIVDLTADRSFEVPNPASADWNGVETLPRPGVNGTVIASADRIEDTSDTDIFRFDPGLSLLTSFEPCDPIDGLQDRLSGDFEVTFEQDPSIIHDCENSDGNDGLVVLSPTGSFRSFFETSNATGVGSFFTRAMSSGTANQVLVSLSFGNTNDPVFLLDPLNREVLWQKEFADIHDVGFDVENNRSVIVGSFGSRAFNEGGTLLASQALERFSVHPHDGFAHSCNSGTHNFSYSAGGFSFNNDNVTDRFLCFDFDSMLETTSDGRFGVVVQEDRTSFTLYNTTGDASGLLALAEGNTSNDAVNSDSGDIVIDAAFSFDSRFLYIATADDILRYDVSSFTGGTTNQAEPTAESTIEGEVVDPGPATGGVLTDNTLQSSADALGVSLGGIKLFLAALLILASAATVAFVGDQRGQAAAGGITGAFVGFIMSLGLGLIPVWVFVLMGIGAIAFIILRGGD